MAAPTTTRRRARQRGQLVASVYGFLIFFTLAFGITFKILLELIIRWLTGPHTYQQTESP